MDEETWIIGSTILAIGAVLLSLGGAVSLARWWWRRRRPVAESRPRTRAEWPPLLLGTALTAKGSLGDPLPLPELIGVFVAMAMAGLALASMIMLVRIPIVLIGRGIRLRREANRPDHGPRAGY